MKFLTLRVRIRLTKQLIVNADDFGYCIGINKGIIQAHEEGIVTSASLMVDAPKVNEAVKFLKKTPKLGVGLHFVLTDEENRVVRPIKQVLSVILIKRAGKEFRRQFEKFIKLTGKLPDHLDSHFNSHKWPRILPLFKNLSEKHKIPIRDTGKIGFINRFFGMNEITGLPEIERVSAKSLLVILKTLPEGITELMCHPGLVTPDLKSSYNFQRGIELRTLTDKRVKDFLTQNKIKLINFSEIP